MQVPVQLEDFERVVFFTGAGLSVASGIPTYRGAGGMWHEYRWEELACEEAFAESPERVWDFHDWRREKVAACTPNPAHIAIADFAERQPASAIVTQNIDGLHQLASKERASAPPVFELHGSLWRVRVESPTGETLLAPTENFDVPLKPRQHSSGVYFRPDIVWFGDALRSNVIAGAMDAIHRCDCLVSIGTSAQVYPAAMLPLEAKKAGAVMIEVNPEPTPLSEVYDHCLRGPAVEILPALCARS